MNTTYCIECDREVFVVGATWLGQYVTCPHCATVMEVISVNPLELDWPQDDDNDDWDSEDSYDGFADDFPDDDNDLMDDNDVPDDDDDIDDEEDDVDEGEEDDDEDEDELESSIDFIGSSFELDEFDELSGDEEIRDTYGSLDLDVGDADTDADEERWL